MADNNRFDAEGNERYRAHTKDGWCYVYSTEEDLQSQIAANETARRLEDLQQKRMSPEPGVGVKHDQDKPDMSLFSPIALTELAKVLSFGKLKYAAHNWRGGISTSRLLAATLRHTLAYLGGQDKDPETGLSHMAHAMCCCMFLLELAITHPQLDDRYGKMYEDSTLPTNKQNQ